jgi:hypothetical protein
MREKFVRVYLVGFDRHALGDALPVMTRADTIRKPFTMAVVKGFLSFIPLFFIWERARMFYIFARSNYQISKE